MMLGCCSPAEESLVQDDEKSSDHFENLQSTNWQTVRFKPPAPGSGIGWRVEFRSACSLATATVC